MLSLLEELDDDVDDELDALEELDDEIEELDDELDALEELDDELELLLLDCRQQQLVPALFFACT